MKRKITNLAKSLGIKKVFPLKFREDDDLYKKFQKLTKYIYKSGTWTKDDTKEAIEKIFEYRVKKVDGSLKEMSLDDLSVPQYQFTETFSGQCYEYSWKNEVGQKLKTYIFVDPDNHSGAKHAKRFRKLDIFGRPRKTSSRSIYNDEGMLFNVDRLVGFKQAEKVLMQEFKEQEHELNFNKREFKQYLRMLVDPSFAGKKYSMLFEKNNHYYGAIVKFIDTYVSSVYEIVIQHEYEKNLENQFRADPATTKANINGATQNVMDNTKLKKHFNFVELDNDVDLKLFKDFEIEMQRIQEVLPTVRDVKPDLRLRKLGNYKANGLYFPFNKTIAIDFRSADTDDRGEYKPLEPGIQSFFHEYGHYLDYNLINSNNLMDSLSLEPDFKPIIDNYVDQLKKNNIYDYSYGKNNNYYAIPTEVFARSFEIYAYKKGLRSFLMKDKNYNVSPEYISFTPEIREKIEEYFDDKIPDFGEKLELLVANGKIAENTKKEGREYTPSLQLEVEGNGLPDQENLIHEFDRPSYLKFNMSLNKKPRQITGFHIANQDELKLLNANIEKLRTIAKFYKDKMSQGNVVYVFKQDNEIKALRVKYGEENFAHLTGIKFDRKSAKEMLENLVTGNTTQNAILVKNDGTTFQKLNVLENLPEVIDASVVSLNNLNDVQQAQRLRFSDALKTSDNKLLLALKEFEPEVYRPYSLINLSDVKHSDYLKVPENTVIAVLSETRSDLGNIGFGTLSLNHDYVNNTASVMEILDVMNELTLKRLEKNKIKDTEKSSEILDNKENKIAENKQKLTEKQIDFAKKQDILAVAQNLGIELISDKGEYYWNNEPNFMIDPHSKTFTWKDKAIYHGNAVNLVAIVKETSFTEAVRYLNNTEIANFDRTKVSYKLNNGQIKAEQPQKQVLVKPQVAKTTVTKGFSADNVPKRVNKEQIITARNRNILEVAQELGMSLKRQGRTYNWLEHDSLVIFPETNTYNWYSRADFGKNPLDLVQSVKGMDFKTAVMYLNSTDLSKFDESTLKTEPQKPFKYLLKDSSDVSKLKEYLINERKISEQTVNDFLHSGVIAQANRIHQKQFEPVIVFKHREASGKLVGASLQGIKENRRLYPERGRLKEIISNSKHDWGVTYNSGLDANQNSFKMVFFEAPIDMMSYYELHRDKLNKTRLVAMNGLKDSTIGKHIAESFGFLGDPSLSDLNKQFEENGLTREDVKERFVKKGVSLKIAVDNDFSGREFINKLSKRYPLIPFEADLPPLLKGREKTDWNDYLKVTKTGQSLEIVKTPKEMQNMQPKTQNVSQKEKVDPQISQKETQVKNSKEFDIDVASAKELSNFAVKVIRKITQDSNELDKYMTMLGKFSEYSPRNVALIYAQNKSAQMVGTYKEWQDRHELFKLTEDDIMYDETIASKLKNAGREYEQKLSVRNGERGKITLFKVKREWKIPRTDDDGNVIKDENGKVRFKQYHPNSLTELEKELLENKKITPATFPVRDRTGSLVFTKYKVFDISQTNLKKEVYSKVVGKHQYNYETEKSKLYKISYALKDYAKNNNIDYKIDKHKVVGLDPNVKGIYHDDPISGKNVCMNKNLDFVESLGVAIRLLSHATVNNRHADDIPKFQRGLEAEIMGHAVAAHFGLKTETRWLKQMSERLQDLSDKELSKTLNMVSADSREFISNISKYGDTPKRNRDRSVRRENSHTIERSI